MNKHDFLDYIVETFGFSNWSEYISSLVHKQSMLTIFLSSITLTTISSALELHLGIKPVLIGAILALLVGEIVSGLMTISSKGEKFSSKKLSRFALKAFTWLIFLYILYSFRAQFQETNKAAFEMFDWLHTGLLTYMCLEYLISVDENLTTITGKDNTFLSIAVRKLKEFLTLKIK